MKSGHGCESGGRGVWTEGAGTFVITDNTVSNCQMDGVDCDSHTQNALVKLNVLSGNVRYFFNNTGDGIESDITGSQNYYSQTLLGGNGTDIVTSGSETFFNSSEP